MWLTIFKLFIILSGVLMNQSCSAKQCRGNSNAEQKSCASSCEPTCATPNPEVCATVCRVNGCECRPGYVREKAGGKCIDIEKCPGNLGCNGDPNSAITNCASACPPTCKPTGKSCAAVCISPGCSCKPGYILSEENGQCIEKKNCTEQPTCKDPNAVPNPCASACQPTCKDPNPEVCTDNCVVNGCECVDGFILDKSDGICIEKDECSALPTCEDPHAVANPCASPCQPTCQNRNISFCTFNCVVNGCECVKGYILNEKGGRCIKDDRCPGKY